MVITCEECSTRFNLDESLLKQEGSRVRCCQCKHVFTAYPPPPLNLKNEQENDDLIISQEPGTDNFSLNNELDLGFSTDPEMLNLDEDEKKYHDNQKIDQYQNLELDQGEDLETFNLNDDLEIYKEGDQANLNDDIELDFDDELELELQDYDDLNISAPETPIDQVSKDLDSNFDIELDVDLDINPQIDSPETDTHMELEMNSQEPELDFDLEIDSQEPDHDMDLEMDSQEPELDFDLEIDSQEPDHDMELEMDSQEPDPDFDLEIDSQEPDHDMDLEMDSQEPDPDFDLEIDSREPNSDMDLEMNFQESNLDLEMKPPESDPDTSVGRATIQPDEEINLSEFDEILEDEEGFLEMEITNDDHMVISDDNYTDTADSPERKDQKTDFIVERTQIDALSKDQRAEKETLEDEPPPFLDYGMDESFKKPVKVGKPIIIVLLLAILVLAGYSACIFYKIEIPYLSNINIPYLSDFLKPAPPTPMPVHLAPDKKSVNGRFVTNATAGTLFVITGGVTNTSKAICSHIKIKGTLITKDKLKAKDKIVFCGNIIDEEQLKNLDMAAINTLLVKETGNNLSNVNIKPGRSIPFMVVFSDLPENLENFTVNVEGFDREISKN